MRMRHKMSARRPKRLRCAVYTRKSSEEGLEQDFNSLDAQREACEAYIKSQAGEGWQLVRTRYDDGGVSGGTLDRPALQQLLADIKARKIDTIVVYKVDRLTRSLADFAKIVEVFDEHGVSFVSVTQQFNTTTSMGRLTLNMLLSFAQFEREVTGERIRDKIAASKRKGMWMGGFVPLGYNAKERSLVLKDAEAETVRTVFRLYLEHGNVRHVKEEADRLGLTTKLRPTQDGRLRGGRPLSRGYIYELLSKPIYVGRIAHRDEVYEGQHAPIIDAETWDAVQEKLAGNAHQRLSGSRAAEPSLLAGLLYDEAGSRLTPSHAVKAGRRYRYYVSQDLIKHAGSQDLRGLRIPAHEIEGLVLRALQRLLTGKTRLFDLLDLDHCAPSRARQILARAQHMATALRSDAPGGKAPAFRDLLNRVTIGDNDIGVVVSISGLRRALRLDLNDRNQTGSIDDTGSFSIEVPAMLKRAGGANKLIIGDDDYAIGAAAPNPSLVKALIRAHDWFGRLAAGQAGGTKEIAEDEGLPRSYVTGVMRLAFLAPDITEAILDGRQPPDLTTKRLIRCSSLPLVWPEQRRLLGFPQG